MANRELKFVCSPWSDRSVISGLSSRCRADEKYQTNQVNSVYFDAIKTLVDEFPELTLDYYHQ